MFPTGLPERDGLIGGGYPSRSTILVEGTAGMRKEVLGYLFVKAGLEGGDTCFYVTRMSADEVQNDIQGFGLQLPEKGPVWLTFEGGQGGFDANFLAGLSFRIKEALRANEGRRTRIAIDLLSSILMLNEPESTYRFLTQLLAEVRRHDAVLLATVEGDMHRPEVLAAMKQLFDGVIELGGSPTSLRVVKMRGVPHQVEIAWATAGSELDKNRVAVLPFANMSPDPNDEYFADGMTEELIDRLAQVKSLRVISRTSVMKYKGEKKGALDVGRELNAGSLIEGSVRKAGNRVRVTVQLINGGTEEDVWSSHYDGTLDEIFTVQSEIAEKVALELKVQLLNEEKKILERRPTENMEAYNAYLRGRELLRDGSESSMRQALKLFERAVELDPSYAKAYLGVADSHQYLSSNGYEPREVKMPAVKAALKRATELDPGLADAHVSLAQLSLNEDDIPSAEAEARRALELDSALPEAYSVLYYVAGIRGKPEEMVRNIETAYRLDPIRRDYVGEVGWAYFVTGREQEALAHWRKTEHLYPPYRGMTEYYLSKGDVVKARELHAKFEKLQPTNPWVTFMEGSIDAAGGDRERAMLTIEKLKEKKMGPVAYNFVAYVYHALGDMDRYFEFLNMALDEHTLFATDMMYSPLLAKAREDPRYGELVEKLRRQTGLEK